MWPNKMDEPEKSLIDKPEITTKNANRKAQSTCILFDQFQDNEHRLSKIITKQRLTRFSTKTL